MIKIYGHSDDVVVIDGDVREELGAYDRVRTIKIGGWIGGLEVVTEYGVTTGVWQLSVRQIDDDVPMPAVVIDCPPGTPVSWDEEES